MKLIPINFLPSKLKKRVKDFEYIDRKFKITKNYLSGILKVLYHDGLPDNVRVQLLGSKMLRIDKKLN